MTRPDQTRHFSLRSWLILIVQTLSLSVVMLGVLVVCSLTVFGSITQGQAWLAGARVVVDQPELHLTFSPTDKAVKLRYEVSNLTGSPVAILGSAHSCSCTVVGKLPDRIEPHSSISVDAEVNIDPKQTSGSLDGNIQLFTSQLQHSELELKYFLRPSGQTSSSASNHVSSAR